MKTVTLLLLAATVALPQSRSDRYALILQDPPLAAASKNRAVLAGAEGVQRAQALELRQRSVRSALEARGIPVTGSMRTLVNAIFVVARPDQAAELASIPGVKRVTIDPPVKRHLNRALELARVPQAWNALGVAPENAGEGIRIAILDTGIDHTHPAFADAGMQRPNGFPLGETAYTNNKIIAARSYVDMLVMPGDAEFSRPDDLSPRDRVGHGTAAAMIAAGRRIDSPVGTISGVAPKAFLGNYKIFGSPGVNDVTFASVIAKALEEAFKDGFDIAFVGAGSPALWGPNDKGAICNEAPDVYCDWRVEAVETAVESGMVVVASAGNDGDLGARYADGMPSWGSVHTPGTAPSAITVGAAYNSQIFYNSVKAGTATYNALFSDGPRPAEPLVARAIDAGNACAPIAGSLAGAIGIVSRGGCAFETKVHNAQNAGAVAVIITQSTSNNLFPIDKLETTGIPSVMIGKDSAEALRRLVQDNPDLQITLDPGWTSSTADAGAVAYFSSQGPSVGEYGIKPEIVAPGTDLFVATQRFDPNGDMYAPTGFTVVQGTSFAAPLAAGAAALVLQRHPEYFDYLDTNTPRLLPDAVKSALVNTADPDVLDADGQANASVTAIGAGQLDAEAAVQTDVSVTPATLSLGEVRGLPLSQYSTELIFRNHSTETRRLQLRVVPKGGGVDPAGLFVDTVVALAPTQPGSAATSQRVLVQLTAFRVPSPGLYEGHIEVSGGAVPLRIPYLYLVGDGVPANIVPLRGPDFIRHEQGALTLTLRVTDQYGVAVPNAQVRFAPLDGNGNRVSPTCNTDPAQRGNEWGCVDTVTGNSTTDDLGIVEAKAFAGSRTGEQAVEAWLPNSNLSYTFFGLAKPRPAVDDIVDLATGQSGGVVPGSYMVIRGRNLSPATRSFTTANLAYSLLGVSVSFDLPGQDKSYAGRISTVTPDAIYLQVPWELAGASTTWVKVSLGVDVWSNPVEVKVLAARPALYARGDVVFALDDAGNPITSDNPAQRGSVISVYANALGPVTGSPLTGEPGPVEAPWSLQERAVVVLGGREIVPEYAGYARGYVGVYELSFRVPADLATGRQALAVKVNDLQTNSVELPIR